jgi:hypothetical protein
MDLVDLTGGVRALMVEEIRLDQDHGRLFISPRLTLRGANDYPALLLEAAAARDIPWLAREIRIFGRLQTMETRRTPSGGTISAKVPVNAADMIAEGEFNRFYIRGLCLLAMVEPTHRELEVYRAKFVTSPRMQSMALIGTRVEPAQLLADLQAHPGVDTALGVPAGPNSGLSVRFAR